MTVRNAAATWSLAIALVLAGGACDSNTLVVRGDAGSKHDGSPNTDVAPVSQPPQASIDGGGQCPVGYAPCGNGDGLRCYDLSRSQDHCGACGNACASGIACQEGTCRQYRCTGALSFKKLVFGSTGLAYALGDFDGDGILDFVGASDYSSPMSLLYGVGDGTFATGQVIEQVSDWPLPDSGMPLTESWQALAADLDGDGLPDLTSIRTGEFAVNVRLGSGSRKAPFGKPTSYPTSSDLTGVLLADFDTDGRLDLVAGVSQGLEYWRGRTGGLFEHQAVLNSSDGVGLPRATDWNGDGLVDLVYGFGRFLNGGIDIAGGRLHYRLSHGDGTFEPEVTCSLVAGIVGDLDHDHRPDLISSSSFLGSSLLLGINGCSATKIVPVTDWTKDGAAALADFNGDGNLDVVIDDNQAIMVHMGDGQGGFPHALTFPAPTVNDQWPVGTFLVGDLNRDGKLDIVFAREGGWGVLLNTCQ
jgi:hypothetical protein